MKYNICKNHAANGIENYPFVGDVCPLCADTHGFICINTVKSPVSIHSLCRPEIELILSGIRHNIVIPDGIEMTDCFYRTVSDVYAHSGIILTFMTSSRDKMHSINFHKVPSAADLQQAVDISVSVLSA